MRKAGASVGKEVRHVEAQHRFALKEFV